jgi:hypothetical protein
MTIVAYKLGVRRYSRVCVIPGSTTIILFVVGQSESLDALARFMAGPRVQS